MLEVDGTRLWRLDDARSLPSLRRAAAPDRRRPPPLRDALAFDEEEGTDERVMALVVLVATTPGLEIFPTHRVFSSRPDLASGADDEPASSLASALARARRRAVDDRAAAISLSAGPRRARARRAGELDVELVDRSGSTASLHAATRRGRARRRRRRGRRRVPASRPTRSRTSSSAARRGEAHAAEEHVLLSRSSVAASSSIRLTT